MNRLRRWVDALLADSEDCRYQGGPSLDQQAAAWRLVVIVVALALAAACAGALSGGTINLPSTDKGQRLYRAKCAPCHLGIAASSKLKDVEPGIVVRSTAPQILVGNTVPVFFCTACHPGTSDQHPTQDQLRLTADDVQAIRDWIERFRAYH